MDGFFCCLFSCLTRGEGRTQVVRRAGGQAGGRLVYLHWAHPSRTPSLWDREARSQLTHVLDFDHVHEIDSLLDSFPHHPSHLFSLLT